MHVEYNFLQILVGALGGTFGCPERGNFGCSCGYDFCSPGFVDVRLRTRLAQLVSSRTDAMKYSA